MLYACTVWGSVSVRTVDVLVEGVGSDDLILGDEAQRVRREVQAHADRVEYVVVRVDVVADAERVDLTHLEQSLTCATARHRKALIRSLSSY